MDINKEKLSEKFKQKDWDYVFKKAHVISDFIISSKFSIYDYERKNDLIQECLENLQKKVLANKIDPEKNLFAFIWKNSNYRILEILRKERNRKRIASFISYNELEGFSDYIDFESNMGERYN